MDDPPNDVRLTDTQLGILAALCRPISAGNHFATPATNQEIAAEVFLSVDAVKGHLRTLYRKFGIEDLPHNQKRARLVELAIEGGYVGEAPPESREESPTEGPATGAAAPAAAPVAGQRASVPLGSASILVAEKEREEIERKAKTKSKRPLTPYVTAAILILVVIGGTLSISGIFNQGSTTPIAPTPAAFRSEVADYCKLALAGAPQESGGDRAERARGYLEVIETMRGRLVTLVPPRSRSNASAPGSPTPPTTPATSPRNRPPPARRRKPRTSPS
jgi:hypothetical protein